MCRVNIVKTDISQKELYRSFAISIKMTTVFFIEANKARIYTTVPKALESQSNLPIVDQCWRLSHYLISNSITKPW